MPPPIPEKQVSAEIRFLSLCGLLGYGFPAASLKIGMEHGPSFIGVDGGSTDPGPYYLGSGRSFVKSRQVCRDLGLALPAAQAAGIPLIVGTAGGSGASPHVDQFLDVLAQVAAEQRLRIRVAVIRTDITPDHLINAWQQGRVRPCGPVHDLEEAGVRECTNLVAQVGVDPIIEALSSSPDVVVTGRCCDTAIFAALPIVRGFDPALALHAAKIAECGTLCALPGGANDSLLATVRHDHFEIRPADPEKRCTPATVAAHSLYEQPSPHGFVEPEGTVDLRACRFDAADERTVRVSGTQLSRPARPTVKIEGARLAGYRALTIAGICDPRVIASLDDIEQQVRERVCDALGAQTEPAGLRLRFLRYGLDAVTGHFPDHVLPAEVGLVIDAVGATQELADAAVSLARSTALHQPFSGRKTTAGNLAFPFSPSDIQAGAVYEFSVYHLLETAAQDPPLWSIESFTVGAGP